MIQTNVDIKDSFHWLCYRPNKYGQCKKPKGLYVVKISPVMAKLIDTMLQPKYDQCKINPDQNTRNKMAYLMERKYTKAIMDNEKCVAGVYSIRDYIKKISANAIQKAVEKMVNNANESI